MQKESDITPKWLAFGLILVVIGTIVFGGLASPAVGGVHAQTNNTTTTQQTTVQTTTATPTTTTTATPTQTATETTTPEQCDSPQLSQSRLYASEKVIETGQAGQIAGGFQVAADAECPVVVSITMSVPSGMSISGASDVVSGGAGMATAQFTVEPGEIKDIRANVYSENAGDRTVTADITYWVEGNKENSKDIDGISMTFDVQEPHTQPATTETNNDGGVAVDVPGFSLVTALLSIAVAAVIAVGRRNR